MRKKLLSALLCVSLCATLLAGCGGGGADSSSSSSGSGDTTEAAAEEGGEDAAAAEDSADEIPTSTAGDPNGTHLEMWTFVELHGTHYKNMVEIWNEQNPDRTIEITCTTYPYGDMHTKLINSLTAGSGAPDICDVEIGQFPNVVAGLDTWLVPVDDYAEAYMPTMVPARMDVYAGEDGKHYGVPYHVGAFVMYYNVAAMSEVMGLSQDEVIAKIDAVETWDDWTALGQEYKDAVADDTKYWTSVDTGGVDWLWLSMAEHGEDWTGGFEGPANVQLESVSKMLKMQQGWLQSGIAEVSPDGHTDLEAGYQNIMDHNIVSFPKAMWYMSRFTGYMPEEKGNWYIAKCPVYEKGQICSVGVGGTGTVVTQQSQNKELAAEFLCWAKMSDEGEQRIWDDLGFDVCNTAMWTSDEFLNNTDNQFNAYFINRPYAVLNEIGMDNIGKIYAVAISPTINDYACTTMLNQVLEDPTADVDAALEEMQAVVDMEQ